MIAVVPRKGAFPLPVYPLKGVTLAGHLYVATYMWASQYGHTRMRTYIWAYPCGHTGMGCGTSRTPYRYGLGEACLTRDPVRHGGVKSRELP